jgi:hypothetical protein
MLQGSIFWEIPSPREKYQLMSFEGKNMKRGRKKEKNLTEKGRKGKEKGKRGNFQREGK